MGHWGDTAGGAELGPRSTHVTAGRRLARSTDDRVWRGVCGGLADYLGVDAGLVRLATILAFVLAGGVAIPAYFIAGFCLPSRPTAAGGDRSGATFGARLPRVGLPRLDARLVGWALVGIGVWLLLPALGLSHGVVLAAALVALGFNLAFRRRG